ncbi:MAG: type II toxin-antitoxin system VapC family toxin [Acidobacteriota bacterium]|nr:type II toxin-antitoxin system VapC family toxin [Acidobacteriota bacterium]
MNDIVVDTHVVIWYFSNPAALSKNAEIRLDSAEAGGTIYVSSITIVELVYLIEKGKIPLDILTLLRDALDDRTTAFRLVELSREIADETENISRSIVPDMPDRIISATALHLNLPFVTRDRMISQLTAIKTIW